MTFYHPIRVTAPAEAPVTLEEAKARCRVTTDDEDALILALIDAAVSQLDGWSGLLRRAIVTQTWAQSFDSFCPTLRLAMPAASVIEVTYTDAAGATQTVPAASYQLVLDAVGSRLVLASGESWPAIRADSGGVRVTFTAGFGAAADVPAPIRQAILFMVADLYWAATRDWSLRKEVVEGVGSFEWDLTGAGGATTSRVVDALLQPFKINQV